MPQRKGVDCTPDDFLGPLIVKLMNNDNQRINPDTCKTPNPTSGEEGERGNRASDETYALFLDFDGVCIAKENDFPNVGGMEKYEARPVSGNKYNAVTPQSLLKLIKDIENSDNIKLYFISDGGSHKACIDMLKKALNKDNQQEIIDKFKERLYFNLSNNENDTLTYQNGKDGIIADLLEKEGIPPGNAVFADDTKGNIDIVKGNPALKNLQPIRVRQPCFDNCKYIIPGDAGAVQIALRDVGNYIDKLPDKNLKLYSKEAEEDINYNKDTIQNNILADRQMEFLREFLNDLESARLNNVHRSKIENIFEEAGVPIRSGATLITNENVQEIRDHFRMDEESDIGPPERKSHRDYRDDFVKDEYYESDQPDEVPSAPSCVRPIHGRRR